MTVSPIKLTSVICAIVLSGGIVAAEDTTEPLRENWTHSDYKGTPARVFACKVAHVRSSSESDLDAALLLVTARTPKNGDSKSYLMLEMVVKEGIEGDFDDDDEVGVIIDNGIYKVFTTGTLGTSPYRGLGRDRSRLLVKMNAHILTHKSNRFTQFFRKASGFEVEVFQLGRIKHLFENRFASDAGAQARAVAATFRNKRMAFSAKGSSSALSENMESCE